MIPVCLVFSAHLPRRLRPYNYFDVGRRHDYGDTEGNRRRLRRYEERCYAPVSELLERLLGRHPRFAFSIAVSGPLLQQLAESAPGRLRALRRLVGTGRAEPLGVTSHHCLPWPISDAELEAQLRLGRALVGEALGREPTVLGGGEPGGSGLGPFAKACGFEGLLLRGVEPVSGNGRGHVYATTSGDRLPVIVRDDQISDDVAIRFSDRRWQAWPLTPEKLGAWIESMPGEVLCLSLDLETFGLTHPRESGIFEFFEAWVAWTLERQDSEFRTPSRIFDSVSPRQTALTDAFPRGANDLQQDALAHLAALEVRIKASGSPALLEDFRRLSSSDHFEAMALRVGDGAPAEPGPFESPYEAYMAFRHAVSDLEGRVSRPRPGRALSAGSRPS